jgi:DeoR/GlpR family transcriptional regulator of sugar metabolism
MVIVLADANKLDRVAFAQVAPLSCVDKIITDNGADPDFISRLRDKNRFLDVMLV